MAGTQVLASSNAVRRYRENTSIGAHCIQHSWCEQAPVSLPAICPQTRNKRQLSAKRTYIFHLFFAGSTNIDFLSAPAQLLLPLTGTFSSRRQMVWHGNVRGGEGPCHASLLIQLSSTPTLL
jgi:hypothetical protein